MGTILLIFPDLWPLLRLKRGLVYFSKGLCFFPCASFEEAWTKWVKSCGFGLTHILQKFVNFGAGGGHALVYLLKGSATLVVDDQVQRMSFLAKHCVMRHPV